MIYSGYFSKNDHSFCWKATRVRENKLKKREIKHLEINVPKVVKDLYLEKIRPWSKKVKIIQTEGKVYLVYGLEKLILLK